MRKHLSEVFIAYEESFIKHKAQATKSSMNSFLKLLFDSVNVSSSAVLQLSSQLARLKFSAMMLGSVGVGSIALWQAHQNIFVALASLGIGSIYTRDIASLEGQSEKQLHTVNCCITQGVKLGILSASLGVLFLAITPATIVHFTLAIFIAISIFGTALFGSLLCVHQGLGQLNDVFKLQASAAGITLILLLCYLLFSVKEPGYYFVSVGGGMLISAMISLYRLKKTLRIRINVSLKSIWDRLHLSDILILSTSGFFIGLLHYGFRAQVAEIYGLKFLGNYQVAWMLSNLVSIIIAMIATSVFLPKLSRENSSKSRIQKLLMFQSSINCSVVLALALWMWFFGELTIAIISDDGFDEALSIYFQVLFGDILRCLTITLSFFFISRRKPTYFITPDVVYGLTTLSIIYFLPKTPAANIVFLAHTSGVALALLASISLAFYMFKKGFSYADFGR